MSGNKTLEVLAGTAATLGVTLVLLHVARPTAAPRTPKTTATTISTLVDETRLLQDAVKAADAAESRALRTRSTEGLDRYYTGAALTMEQAKVEALVRERQREESSLERIEFNDTRYVPGSATATVLVTETWKSRYYNQETGVRVGSESTTVCPQKVELVRRDGRWLVRDVEHFTPATPEPTPTPQPTPRPAPRPEPTAELSYTRASSSVKEAIQNRYDERAEAFEEKDLEAYFDYAAPGWQWRSEDGDHSSLAEAQDYYRKVFAKGESRSLRTQLIAAYSVEDDLIVADVLIGTEKGEDEGRLIHQLDVWVHRDGEWYCLREYRLARSGAFSLAALRQALAE